MLNSFLNILFTLIFWSAGSSDFNNQLINYEVPIISANPQIEELSLAADKVFVLSLNNRAIFYSKKADVKQPIASITKLMTALVFLENNPGWEESYTITRDDNIAGGYLNLFLGEQIKIKDIFATSLIASDNGAAMALVHASGLSEEEFVNKMNEKAKALFLVNTQFIDPTGLSDSNVSTAREVALLAKEALMKNEINDVVSKKEYLFSTPGGREKKIESTNYLLFDTSKNNFQILGAKTGYTDEAGYCFVGRFAEDNREVISVVLNSDGKNERFKETKNLINWVFANYNW